MAILDDLCDRLSENPPRFPSWIFVPATSVPPILGAINYWIDTAKTTKTEKTLEFHEVPDMTMPTASAPGMPGPMFPQPGNLGAYSQKLFEDVASAGLEGMTGEQLVGTGLVPGHLSPSQARQYRERHKSQLLEVMLEKLKADLPSADTDVEVKWYKMTKTLPIPKELEARHTILKQLSGAVRRGKDTPGTLVTKVAPPRQCSVSDGLLTRGQAQREIATTWKPNITLYVSFTQSPSLISNKIPQSEGDQLLGGDRKGYPTTSFNLPTAIRSLRLFNPSKCSIDGGMGTSVRSDTFQSTYDWTSRMLGAAADTLVALKDSIKVEFICTEMFSELQLMRNGEDHHRPKEFPRSFLRVWVSNIP